MKEWEERLIGECNELGVRLDKLECFLGTDASLSWAETTVLRAQADVMKAYSNILKVRCRVIKQEEMGGLY